MSRQDTRNKSLAVDPSWIGGGLGTRMREGEKQKRYAVAATWVLHVAAYVVRERVGVRRCLCVCMCGFGEREREISNGVEEQQEG